MEWLPLLLIGFIVGGVLLCVFVAVIVIRLRGQSIGINLFTLLAIMLFCTSFIAFFITAFASPTRESWWHALVVRIGWQVGSAFLLAIAVITEASNNRKVWILAVVFLALGVAMSFNPLVDLVEGPLVWRGKHKLEVHNTLMMRGGTKITAELFVTAPGGEEHLLHLAGWGASDAITKLEKCSEDKDVEVEVLKYVARVLDASCDLSATKTDTSLTHF